MLYHLFDYLNSIVDLPGSGMMRYLSFRSVMAVVSALLIVIYCGKGIIRALQRHQIGESIRDLGLQGQLEKKGTPTMGGVIILLGIVVPVLLFARLDNIYTILLLVAISRYSATTRRVCRASSRLLVRLVWDLS